MPSLNDSTEPAATCDLARAGRVMASAGMLGYAMMIGGCQSSPDRMAKIQSDAANFKPIQLTAEEKVLVERELRSKYVLNFRSFDSISASRNAALGVTAICARSTIFQVGAPERRVLTAGFIKDEGGSRSIELIGMQAKYSTPIAVLTGAPGYEVHDDVSAAPFCAFYNITSSATRLDTRGPA